MRIIKQYNILEPIVNGFYVVGMDYEQYGMNNDPPKTLEKKMMEKSNIDQNWL